MSHVSFSRSTLHLRGCLELSEYHGNSNKRSLFLPDVNVLFSRINESFILALARFKAHPVQLTADSFTKQSRATTKPILWRVQTATTHTNLRICEVHKIFVTFISEVFLLYRVLVESKRL